MDAIPVLDILHFSEFILLKFTSETPKSLTI